VILVAGLLSPCLAAAPSAKVRRVGVLGVEDYRSSDWWSALVDELAKRGYVEGKTLSFVSRTCGEKLDLLDPMAKEIVALGVELIISTSGDALGPLRRATRTIPIVMTASSDPVRDGWVASLAHPGGNITGNTVSGPDIELKQLELLIEALGTNKRIAHVVFEAFRSLPAEVAQTARFEALARTRGILLETLGAADGHALDGVFRKLARGGCNGVVLQNHATIGLDGDEVASLGLRHGLPVIMAVQDYARAGVLFTFSPSMISLYRKTAVYVDRILSGAKPADLPVELPTKYEFVINLKTASALGLTVPPSILLRADEVIR
jgi:putative ABC transport system substrate-binding protein